MIVGLAFDPRQNCCPVLLEEVANNGIEFVAAVFSLLPGQDLKDDVEASEL